MGISIVGLDGVTRSESEVFASDARAASAHGHGLATEDGYMVRRTYFGGQAHADVGAFYGAGGYSEALKTAHTVREQQGAAGYAVIDRLYSCGCRVMG